jgi:hypothetical protein
VANTDSMQQKTFVALILGVLAFLMFAAGFVLVLG